MNIKTKWDNSEEFQKLLEKAADLTKQLDGALDEINEMLYLITAFKLADSLGVTVEELRKE